MPATAEQPRRVAIALGSNLGDRRSHLQHGIRCLADLLDQLVASRPIETAPQGVDPSQPSFLNAVAVGWSAASPADLLARLQAIENGRGRERPYPGAPRTLDLDLILVGSLVLETEELVLPHPRFRQRSFVLGPLAAVAPDMVDPVTGLTAHALHRQLETSLLKA